MRSITGMGVEFECRISRARAQQLIGEKNDLPLMGWERLIREVPLVKNVPRWMGYTQRLWLKNISGILVLASETTAVKHWVEVFGPEFQHYVDRAEIAAGQT